MSRRISEIGMILPGTAVGVLSSAVIMRWRSMAFRVLRGAMLRNMAAVKSRAAAMRAFSAVSTISTVPALMLSNSRPAR